MTSPLTTMLDTICPMHIVLDSSGTIEHVGPTMKKMLEEHTVESVSFFAFFDVKRPRHVSDFADLMQLAGNKLRLTARFPPFLDLRAVLMPGLPDQRIVVNLSFGISVARAVQEYNLTASDFAVTDLAVEMLYLVEAKSAAMEASKELNKKLETARDAAEKQALTDALTGLSNRRALDSTLSRLIWSRAPFALVHLDLDFFKAINDTLGHAAGDFVLVQVAEVLRKEIRGDDLVARVGGDEFVIVLRSMIDRETIGQIASRIISSVSRPMTFGDEICQVNASVGIALSNDCHLPEAETLSVNADRALYAAKRGGRGKYVFFEENMSEMEASSETDAVKLLRG